MGMSDKVKAYIALTSTALFWGASFISIKICMEVFGPLYLAFFRYLLTTFIMYAVLKITNKLQKIDRGDYRRLAISGLAGTTIYFACENNAVLRISSNEAAILIGSIPIFALIFNRFIYKSRITPRNAISIAASIFGIYLIIGGAKFSLNAAGYFFMMGAAVSWSVFQFVTKPLFSKYSAMTLLMYQSFFGVLGFLPFLKFDYLNMPNMNAVTGAHFLFLTLFCSVIGTFFYLFGQKNLGINITSVFLNLIPVFTFLLSFVFFREVMSFLQMLGALIVIVSVSCVKEEVYPVEKPGKDINIEGVFEGE